MSDMKPYFIPVCLMILIAGNSCKKDESENIPVAEKKWIVTTVAGDGTPSFADGPVMSAKFHFPEDVVVARDGTIYVTDGDNSRIRKIAGGQVSTFAGGSFGIENGNGPSAEFKYPFSVTLDANGNMYTSDIRDSRIRKLNSSADAFFYGGTDERGFADGNADTARFGEETSVAVDDEGNVYVVDSQNNRVRKISVSGTVSTIAGSDAAGFRDGKGQAAQFNFPDGIAIDKQGNLYVSDGANYCIRKINSSGEVSVFAGHGGLFGVADGDAGAARFDFPTDMVIDKDGNLYVLDISRVRKISPSGIVSTIAGSTDGFADGDGATAKFFTPDGLGIDSEGNIYVADTNNNRIRKISSQ